MIAPAETRIDYVVNGEVVAFMVPDASSDDLRFEATIHEVEAWDDDGPCDAIEIGRIYMKWDGCTHVGLRDPTMSKEWVHVCGAEHMRRVLSILEWAWREAQARIPKFDESIGEKL